MEPLQVWVPLVGAGLGFPDVARDVQRAFLEWDHDHRVWLLPGLTRQIRWREEGVQLLGLPAERLECVDVYHVGENGFVSGPANFDRFPGRRVDGLLEAWLNVPGTHAVRWAAPWPIEIPVPEIAGEEIGYRNVKFTVPVLPFMPEAEGGLLLKHPQRAASAVFPEAEVSEALRELHGELWTSGSEDRAIFSKDGSFIRRAAALEATGPLKGLFVGGVTLDGLHHWVKMSGVLRQARTDPAGALHRALTLAGPYLSTGRSTRAKTWLQPTLSEVEDYDLAVQRAATLGLNSARNWEEAKSSTQWRAYMTEYIPVRRAWGPIGLFWVLLLERLKSAQVVNNCIRCGRKLIGTRRKQLCGRGDNAECYRQRRADDRRRERSQCGAGMPKPPSAG